MACQVIHKRDMRNGDVYIGRGSRWGNPYRIGQHGDRDTVIAKYRTLLWKQIQSGEVTKDQLRALDGHRLACYCTPQRCHGDVLAAAVEWTKTS